MQPDDPVIVLTTWPAQADAWPFAADLVEQRLAACVNLLPEMESVYRWEGRVERERERQLVIKTTAGRIDAIRQRLAEVHPYELPEMLVLAPADGGPRYLDWLRESSGGSAAAG